MKRVIIESPYAGDVKRNVKYAKACLYDSLARGEAPIASHLLYTQVLNDKKPGERKKGIEAGLEWLEVADLHVFYIDLGYSPGMLEAFKISKALGRQVEERSIIYEGKKSNDV